MDNEIICDFLTETFLNMLDEDLLALVACGSLGRGNFVEKWSDIDLLLVVRKANLKILSRVKQIEAILQNHLKTKIDIFLVTQQNILLTPSRMHSKLRNYLFFISQEKILINRNVTFKEPSYQEVFGEPAVVIVEHQKNLRRLVIETNLNDSEQSKKLCKRIIKITFLILKVSFSNEDFQPVTYDEIIKVTRDINQSAWIEVLEKYNSIRKNNLIEKLSKSQLLKEIENGIEFFEDVSHYLLVNNKIVKTTT